MAARTGALLLASWMRRGARGARVGQRTASIFTTPGLVASAPQTRPCLSLWCRGVVGVVALCTSEMLREERELVHRITIAQTAVKDGDTARAERLLEAALRRAEERGVRVGVLCALDMLATLAYARGDTHRAQQLLSDAIYFMDNVLQLSRDDPQVVSFLLKLARLYTKESRDAEAEQKFKECISLMEHRTPAKLENADNVDALWVSTLFWYSVFLNLSGRSHEALRQLERAYSNATSMNSSAVTTPQLMVILHHLSDTAYSAGHTKEAIRYLLNAVTLGRECGHPELASYCLKLGALYGANDQPEPARTFCEQARKLAKRSRDTEVEQEANKLLAALSSKK